MIKEYIKYVNKLGKTKILEIIKNFFDKIA